MTVPTDPATVALPISQACSSCGAPLAGDQRYCLHCGEPRTGARRPMPAALLGSIHPPPERIVTPPTPPRVPPGLAAGLAGLACLLLAMGIGVMLGRGGGEPSAPAPATVAAVPVATAPAIVVSDWPAGTEGWTVALAQLPKATTTAAAVAQAKTAAEAKGANAVGALDAGAYASLTAGSYVVYSGVFDTEKAATAARAGLTAAFPDAAILRVGTADASPTATAKGGASKSPTTAKKSAASEEDAGVADTTKEFEKSKKAPKTVGTGGKPPPKDDKPAAGGADFEEIG